MELQSEINGLKLEIFVKSVLWKYWLNRHGNLCKTHNLVNNRLCLEFWFKIYGKSHIFILLFTAYFNCDVDSVL